MELKYRTAPAALDTEQEGRLKAAFSVFDELDSDQDIVRKSAFTDGQAVPLVWSHSWDKPIGKGVVHLTDKHAEFDGAFFTDTSAGMDAYRTVKAMGELQEFSFGFEIKESRLIKHQDKDAREITKITLFEVSPVLVGANRNTRTLAIKSGEPLNVQGQQVLDSLLAYVDRLEERAGIRAKEGRRLSTQTRDLIAAVLEAIDTLGPARERLSALYDESAPRSSDDEDAPEKAANAALVEFLAFEARSLGVEV